MPFAKGKQRNISGDELLEEHLIVGPPNKLSLYKTYDKEGSDGHKIVAGVYERPQLMARYDSNIVRDILDHSNRYKHLKPSVVLQLLGESPKYGYVKKFAISRLEENLKKQIEIFSQIIVFSGNEAKPSDDLLHNIFSWKWNEFLKRRRLTNFVWVDVLLRMDKNGLYVNKFQKDLEELHLLIENIFDGLFSNIGQGEEEERVNIYQHIQKPIDEAKKLLHIIENIEEELLANSEELKHFKYKQQFSMNGKRVSEDRMLKAHLENRIWNSHIWDPIEVRYNLNWFQNKVKQNQYRVESAVEKYKADIGRYRKLLNLETSIDGNCMDYCYSSIELYKNRLIAIQNKLDKELDEIDNKLASLRMEIDKFKEQQQRLTEEIERFHEEEEQMRIRNEAERKKEEEREKSLEEAKNVPTKKAVKKQNKKQKR